MIDLQRLDRVLDQVRDEVIRATSKHGEFASAHEGFAVLQEEVDELWDEVKMRDKSLTAMEKEATQVAAMGVRFLVDVCQSGYKKLVIA